ncbi:hypothetical protein UABAM_06319 [Candidatus Uabimicrobium amorphum]|uniref:Uncharacterized protein n=1 Tax=Uabimicrobium amorphum TaxID=2596890 RepID=A0A5S9F7Q5_UABAM|nr:hypothetical protein [Candidatus Uabimicrobium amorphum]BBM87904.1 hypothetical protein UABAM_06319 [Candidatus Uabimicrobium amorphum]
MRIGALTIEFKVLASLKALVLSNVIEEYRLRIGALTIEFKVLASLKALILMPLPQGEA